jgi:hypothetical protein
MATKKTEAKSNEIEVVALKQEEVTFCLLGQTPFYCNRVASKAMRELLMPRGGRLTAAQKAQNLKHAPLQEFRDSPYLRRGDGPTRIMMLATAIKGAIAQTAVDMPTAVAKTQINRLTYVVDEFIDIYGVPVLDMAVVRMADPGRTPDIRTRAKIPAWATRVTIRYTLPMLSAQKVATLLSASGMICGIGDFRQEKGKGNNGLFQIVPADDPRFLAIVARGGMAQQDAALAAPECSNVETEDLLVWYQEEVVARRAEAPKEAAPKAPRKSRSNGEARPAVV